MELTMMQVRREVLRLMGLTIAFVAMAGCVPHSLPGLIATTQPAETVAPTTTSTSTETVTPTLQPTATEAPTLAPTPDRYEIDGVKLNNWPESYEYLVSHLDEFIEAPDPLTDIVAFKNWFYGVYIPAYGDLQKLESDIAYSSIGSPGNSFPHKSFFTSGAGEPLLKEPNIFYFKHDGKFRPVLVITGSYHGQMVTNATILDDGGYLSHNNGVNVIEKMVPGKHIQDIWIFTNVDPGLPEFDNEIIEVGLNGSGTLDEVRIGPGFIILVE
jgi:hypothetical protein